MAVVEQGHDQKLGQSLTFAGQKCSDVIARSVVAVPEALFKIPCTYIWNKIYMYINIHICKCMCVYIYRYTLM